MVMDAAPPSTVLLYGIDFSGDAVFRGKPSDLDVPPRYTFGVIEGLRRRWEVHVDLNVVGASGASHGVDVAVLPETNLERARRLGGSLAASGLALGMEAKCFNIPLTPNEGRVALGFHADLDGAFWLAANSDNQAVRDMLSMPGRKTALFAPLLPASVEEARFRAAAKAHLKR